MTVRSSTLALAIVALDLCARPGTGGADTPSPQAPYDTDAARIHFRRALTLFEEANYAAARVEFEAAYAEKPSASSLQNSALCLKALFRYAEAADTLRRLLERHSAELTARERAGIERAIAELDGLVGTLRLSVEPRRALVEIDGSRISPEILADPIRLDVGEHQASAQAPGYAPRTITVRVVAGPEPTAVTLALRPVAGFISVKTDDSEAAIAIDGEAKAFASWIGPVPPGRHYVQIYRDGFVTLERVVVVELGKTMVVKGRPGERETAPIATSSPRAAVPTHGWYGLAGVALRSLDQSPAGYDATNAQTSGAGLQARAGYRPWDHFSLELFGETARWAAEDACPTAVETPTCKDAGVTLGLSMVRLGANVRVMSGGERARFIATLGTGMSRNQFTVKRDAIEQTAWDGYLLLELGGQFNFGHVLLESTVGVLGGAGDNLTLNDTPLFESGLPFFGLTLLGGYGTWAPRTR